MPPKKNTRTGNSLSKKSKTTQPEGYIFKGMKRGTKETKRKYFERCLDKNILENARKLKKKTEIPMINPDDTGLSDMNKYLVPD